MHNIVEYVLLGRAGFGLKTSKLTKHKAFASEMVVHVERRQEEVERSATKVLSLARQGQWTRWEGS